jgi:predicted RNase H-like HicB family nuclease
MRYLIVIERAEKNYSAYAPDVPGCVSTGRSVAETVSNMAEALKGHLQLMAEDGEPIPDPATTSEYLDVELPQHAASAQIGSSGKVS